ncbi:hypothetical protein ATJ88_0284 [Isoptericola jiangsuensis]|uniref:PepSY domain-containing protein n=1 Tax=Isoptericola jiangsuensis TaxID=548579 RepID=A0A2A9ETP8_9MICO|nr:hypothetical protein [Isoptericola jiangsuensis]PFG41642.1 hypothetical protein ATJ88_0284 [Isoptericola jiangsuensis]
MTRRHPWSLPALTLVAALALTGCTGSSAPDDAPSSATPSAKASSPDASADGSDGASPEASASTGAGSGDGTGDTDDSGSGTDDGAAGGGDVDPTTGALGAIALAAAEAGGAPFAVDAEDGGWVVDVAVDGGAVEVSVDAAGTEVQGTRDADLDADDRAALEDAAVGLPEAVQRVVSTTGGTLREADLESGRSAHWSVSVTVDGAEQEHRVDLATGDVTRDDG